MTNKNHLNIVTLNRRPSKRLIELHELLQQMNSCGVAIITGAAEGFLYKSVMEGKTLQIDENAICPEAIEPLIAAGLMRDKWMGKLLVRAREMVNSNPRIPKSSATIVVLKSAKRKGSCTTTA